MGTDQTRNLCIWFLFVNWNQFLVGTPNQFRQDFQQLSMFLSSPHFKFLYIQRCDLDLFGALLTLFTSVYEKSIAKSLNIDN